MMLSAAVWHAAGVLADTTPDGPENKKASALGLAVILALCIGCYFLFRSMSRHLRKVRDNFPVNVPRSPHRDAQPPADQLPGTRVPRAPVQRTPVPRTPVPRTPGRDDVDVDGGA